MRHGRTAWNREGRFQGHAEVPLDATGLAQAAALAEHLRGERFDVVASSDLGRARATAEAIVAGRPGPSLETDPRWRELDFGAWEGRTAAEVGEQSFGTPPGGESFADLCARVEAALAGLRARLPAGGTVLVATHAGPLHALLHTVFGREAAETLGVRFGHGTLTRIILDDGPPRLLELNVAPAAREGVEQPGR